MLNEPSLIDYGWSGREPYAEVYLLKPLRQLIEACSPRRDIHPQPLRVLDLGCGNGALSEHLLHWGYEVVDVDPSPSGILAAQDRCPTITFHQASADPSQLRAFHLKLFDVVVSTEVIEHVYAPRLWASAAFEVLKPGGLLICSTPYHGYFKNCALALSGKLDAHFTALWDGGHIKFWSLNTLSQLLKEAGFKVTAFRGAGRCPWLWKSMLIAARKPLF